MGRATLERARKHAAAAGLAGLALAGCGTARYVPKRPDVQETGIGSVTPTRYERSALGGEALTLESSLAQGSDLRAVSASNRDPELEWTSREGCAGGEPLDFSVDGEHRAGTTALDVSGRRKIVLPFREGHDHVVLELERGGWRSCVPVSVDWPDNWHADPPWELLLSMGADFNVAGDDSAPGVGGFRLAAFRWDRTHRFGVEVGVLNSDLCDEGQCGWVVPVGLEGDWLLFASEEVSLGAAFIAVGLRAMAYAPVTATDSVPSFSPQATLRLVGSFPPGGPRPMPAGLTLDHGVWAGPALTTSGATSLLVGYSLGIGWAL